MRIEINKEDIEILIELVHNEIKFINQRIPELRYVKWTEQERNEMITKYKKERKKLRKIHNKLFDKIIEMEYYEEQNTKHKDNRTDNSFFNYVADIMSRDYRNEEKPSTDNWRIDL